MDLNVKIKKAGHPLPELRLGRRETTSPSFIAIEECLHIHRDFFSRANLIMPDGVEPAWILDSIAATLSVSRTLLIQRLKEAAFRFDELERADLT